MNTTYISINTEPYVYVLVFLLPIACLCSIGLFMLCSKKIVNYKIDLN